MLGNLDGCFEENYNNIITNFIFFQGPIKIDLGKSKFFSFFTTLLIFSSHCAKSKMKNVLPAAPTKNQVQTAPLIKQCTDTHCKFGIICIFSAFI